MNFTDKQLEWLRWFAVCALVFVFGFLGLQTPAVPPTPQNDFGILATNQKITSNRDGSKITVASGGEIEFASGATLDLQSGALGTLNAADATFGGGYGSTGCTISAAGVLQCDGAATLASTLTLGSHQFSGAVRGGSATSVADGGTITHTLAAPPNWCTVTPYTIGMTATVATVTTTTLTINVNKTGNVYWSCGF